MRIDASKSALDPQIAARLKRDASGLVAAIAQQYDTGEVLMVAWMDDEALHRTLTTGRCTYWSRSRQEYWVKGETSGHAQAVKSVALDCDGDALPHQRPHLLRRRRPPARPLSPRPGRRLGTSHVNVRLLSLYQQ
jgi:phosphoribosyl-AMP cyclohydrolase